MEGHTTHPPFEGYIPELAHIISAYIAMTTTGPIYIPSRLYIESLHVAGPRHERRLRNTFFILYGCVPS